MLNILLAASTLFLLTLLLHIAIWRVRPPYASALVLVFLMVGLPTIGLAALMTAPEVVGPRVAATDVAAVLLLHVSLAAAYIASYPAARAVSPSLDILCYLASAGPRGLTEAEMTARYTAERILQSRIDDLAVYKFLFERDGRYHLSRMARVVAAGFLAYRKLLGLPVGQG